MSKNWTKGCGFAHLLQSRGCGLGQVLKAVLCQRKYSCAVSWVRELKELTTFILFYFIFIFYLC